MLSVAECFFHMCLDAFMCGPAPLLSFLEHGTFYGFDGFSARLVLR